MEKRTIKAITEIIDGKMLAVASDESIDRVGDSLKAIDWDLNNFRKNPVLQAGHDYRPQFTIGVAKNMVVQGNKLIFEPIFHTITQLAREIKEMYEQGILKAWSVGYIPGEENGLNELLEVSAVAVPANANALVIAKGMDSSQEKEVGDKIKEFIDGETKEEVKEEKPEEKKEEKSPMCRMSNETEKECVTRKIPEIMNEDPNIKQDQAVAMAISMCGKACSEKEKPEEKKEEVIEVKEPIKEEIKVIIPEEKKEKIEIKKEIEDTIIEKEGRVISASNKSIIEEAITAGKNAVSAMEKLLEISDTSQKEVEEVQLPPQKVEGGENKGREPKIAHKELSVDELAVHTLKEITRQTNFALCELNKKNK